MTKYLVMPMLVAASLSSAAMAQSVDNFAANAIRQHDYATAEAQLNASLAHDPGYPPAMLNLAYVYRHTAREAAAITLYRDVLARLETNVTRLDNGQSASSYDIATEALARKTTFASR